MVNGQRSERAIRAAQQFGNFNPTHLLLVFILPRFVVALLVLQCHVFDLRQEVVHILGTAKTNGGSAGQL